ncbi:MAG: 1-acyl-sn-glycerol-3-phosphate acyltransferase [Clostridiales bacterium]|nr:1-acyl-sn-glycerol-3-phosphate acyltransferase [Clostridiales bacterium]
MAGLFLIGVFLGGFLLISTGPLLIAEKLVWKEKPKRWQEYCLKVVQGEFHCLLRVAGVTITVKGQEHIPEEPVLYVGNHSSYFDILVGYVTVPGLTGFVAKKELERVPGLAQWMRSVNCLFLDREDIRAGLATIRHGIEKVKNGVSIWIFPEGTRNMGEDLTRLLPFKEGSLKIAEKAGCPVVPVAITGTPDVWEKHLPWIHSSHVTIEYGEPIYIKKLPPQERKHVGAYAQSVIEEMLRKEQKERRNEGYGPTGMQKRA